MGGELLQETIRQDDGVDKVVAEHQDEDPNLLVEDSEEIMLLEEDSNTVVEQLKLLMFRVEHVVEVLSQRIRLYTVLCMVVEAEGRIIRQEGDLGAVVEAAEVGLAPSHPPSHHLQPQTVELSSMA